MTDANDYFVADVVPEPPGESSSPVPPDPPARAARAVPDLTLESGLPAAIDAEKTILGAVLLDDRALVEILKAISADDLSLDSHRRILLRMADLKGAGRSVDIVTLSNELARNREIEAVGGVAYLASLTEGLPRRPVISEYLRIVKDKSLLRKIMVISSATIARAADQSETALEILDWHRAQLGDVIASLPRGSDKPFFVGYRTFVAEAVPEIDWTVEGIIQQDGNGLVLGDSGTSKSLLVFHLALHLVSGATWFQHRVPRRIKVGLVAREDAPGLSQSRLKRLVAGAPMSLAGVLDYLDLEDSLYLNTKAQRETWTLQSEADIQDVIEAIQKRGINMVFFDVFRALWSGNENDNQETARVLASVNRIAAEAKCQACLVHHLSKSDRGTIFDRARGGGINGWKEWGLGLTVENPDADPVNQVRQIQFHTKADCASAPIYYRILGDHDSVHLEQVEAPSGAYSSQPTPTRNGRGKKKQPEEAQRTGDTDFPFGNEF
ncbi:MAG TPA: AAA family ATPase [Candidatus Acidoferrales bacterium]|nr:AAA family ATPase [Candidatus Acidoferrales bacterium]